MREGVRRARRQRYWSRRWVERIVLERVKISRVAHAVVRSQVVPVRDRILRIEIGSSSLDAVVKVDVDVSLPARWDGQVDPHQAVIGESVRQAGARGFALHCVGTASPSDATL